ncbi:MAG: DUF6250 domain-containing protein [Verrucomicrobiota bacterium]
MPSLHKCLPVLFLLLWAATARLYAAGLLFHDDFTNGLGQWIVEQRPGGTVAATNGVLEIRDVGGGTIWFKQKLIAPVRITYQATVVDEQLPGDRVSDLNCFWMASDPEHSDDLFWAGHGRDGVFSGYDRLCTYYVGYGGNQNSTTRFRRYLGLGPKPLSPENDLRDPRFLLQPNHAYQIELEAMNGMARFRRDGECLFEFSDPRFLQSGWFGFRFVNNHLRIRNFAVKTLPPGASPVKN